MATNSDGGSGLSPAAIIRAILGSGWTFQRGFFRNGGDPITGYAGHFGWDISAKQGTPIPSFHDGTVVIAGSAGATGIIPGHPEQGASYDVLASGLYPWVKGGGNVVVIASGGVDYVYAHMNTINVKPGDHISSGQMIGTVGSTGDATGAHLHFGMIQLTSAGKPDKFVDPSSFLATLAQGGTAFNLLGAWNNAVAFPTGHILTAADVDAIISQLDQQHFFQATGGIPGLNQLAENAARDKTRAILMSHVGEAWNSTLEQSLQTQLFGAAAAATSNPLQSLADVAGKLVDPMTYVHTGALLIGLTLAFIGFRWAITQAGGKPTETVG